MKTGQKYLFVFDDLDFDMSQSQTNAFDILKIIISRLLSSNVKLIITSRSSHDKFCAQLGINIASFQLKMFDQKKTREFLQLCYNKSNDKTGLEIIFDKVKSNEVLPLRLRYTVMYFSINRININQEDITNLSHQISYQASLSN